MKKVYYEKVGRKYIPVSEYDSEFAYSLPKGNHLIMVHPGGSTTKHNVKANCVALIAASRIAEDAISNSIMKASELRRNSRSQNTPLTPEQKEAWDNLVKVFGDDARQLEWPSARECAQAGIDVLIEEAEKLMTVPAVKKAYEQFMFVAELTKEHNDESES